MREASPAPRYPATVDPVTRFILSSNHFAKASGRVKHAAFMPPDDLKLSVFIISGLHESMVWALGQTHVAGPQSKTLHARADVLAGAILDAGLKVDVDNVPIRHANVIDWPADKSVQKLKAVMLAESAVLQLPQEPEPPETQGC